MNLGLHLLNRVGGHDDLERDGFAGEGLDNDLHSATETKHKMPGGFFLDVVVFESTTILELLSGNDEALLLRRYALLVLNLGLNVLDGRNEAGRRR